jgi:hypothetical protein
MSNTTTLTRRRKVYDKIFVHCSPYDLLTTHVLLGRHEGREDASVDKLARLAESNKELVEKNSQLDKELKDEVARLTSENTKLKELKDEVAAQGLLE